MSTASEMPYHVVRPCPPHLEKPAVFSSLKDAKHFVDNFYDFWVEDYSDEEDVEVDNRMNPSFIQTFNVVQEFFQYTQQLQHQLEPKKIGNNLNNKTEEDRGTDDDDSASASVFTSDASTTPRKRTVIEGREDHSTKKQRTQDLEEIEEEITPCTQKAAAARRQNCEKRWQTNLDLLQAYKVKHGTAFVEDEHCVGKFAKLKKSFKM